MAEGLRIRPKPGIPINDHGMIIIIDHARPFRPPADGTPLEKVQPVCRLCLQYGFGQRQHFAKTYHLLLRAGSVIVSSGVWEALEALADNPMELVNPVPEPPKQRLTLSGVGVGGNGHQAGKLELVEKWVPPIG